MYSLDILQICVPMWWQLYVLMCEYIARDCVPENGKPSMEELNIPVIAALLWIVRRQQKLKDVKATREHTNQRERRTRPK